MNNNELVYVGIKGKVVAMSRATGEIRWMAELGGSWISGSGGFVHLVVDGDCVFASAQGEITCLDAATGSRRWHNALRGFGVGIASIATRNSSSPANLPADAAQQDAAAAAIVASTSAH